MYQKLIKFSLVGGVGFIIDASVFALLSTLFDWDLLVIRGVAFICAATTTWLGNRVYTFVESSAAPRFEQWKKFVFSACLSAIPNFVVFKLSLELISSDGWYVYLALVLGVLAGMVSNFMLSSRWVFNPSRE